jgi:RNA polymerase sigma-70 factor (ECF subfamily)
LYEGIKQLSEVDRAIITLYLEELSYKEIAQIIGTNTNNIGVKIKRIKNRLEKILTKNKF